MEDILTKRYYHVFHFYSSLNFFFSLHEPVISDKEEKYCGQGDEAMQNLMVLAFMGNKGTLIKGCECSKASRLHSGWGPSALQPV